MNDILRTALLTILTTTFTPAADMPLPLPAPQIPENPAFPPLVITSGGQRLLLEHTDVTVHYDAGTKELRTSHPGWWVVNYPLKQIAGTEGGTRDEIARLLFGKPVTEVKNYYLRTPGPAAPEPPAPTGPAPIRPSSGPAIIVDQGHSAADDGNPGTSALPLRTVSAAVAKAAPGSVVRVHPGIYRETVTAVTPGTRDKPIVLEGLRDKDGTLPVISGNDPAPPDAWTAVTGHPGVWRAENWTAIPSNLSLDGSLLRERTVVSELGPNEYCHNFANRELAFPTLSGTLEARTGTGALGANWRTQTVDDDGFLDLREKRGVFYLSTWFWIPPGKRKEAWDPRFPEPITGDVKLHGPFRAGRQSSNSIPSQLNLYRMWLNGDLMPAAGRAGEPRANTDYGRSDDHWKRLPFREGWNHIVLLLDSAPRQKKSPHRLKFTAPKGAPQCLTSATKPPHLTTTPTGKALPHVAAWSVLGPVTTPPASTYEDAIYLKLAPGEDPNKRLVDMGRRTMALDLKAPYWTVRGLEFVHGTQYQQRTLVNIGAPGVTIEHCLFRETEVRTLTLGLSSWNQSDDPAIVRGNWFVSPGSLGIGGSGNSKRLTPENQSGDAPGRGRALVEHNVIIDNNRSGYARFWESGGMKFFRMTGCVIRHNSVLDGDGPAIWLDWEHYNNRLEGNFLRGATGFGIGVEASPGPNLFANNVVVDIKPGGAWFRYGLLAWSSARTWAVGNTLATDHGAMFAEGGDDRGTVWKKLPERNAALANNLVTSKSVTLHRGNVGWMLGNRLYGPGKGGIHIYSKWRDPEFGERIGAGPQLRHPDQLPPFRDPEHGDYRYSPTHEAARAGTATMEVTTGNRGMDVAALVRHDFFGLLRFPQDGIPAGAFRNEPQPARDVTSQVEIEWRDGTNERRWNNAPNSNCRLLDLRNRVLIVGSDLHVLVCDSKSSIPIPCNSSGCANDHELHPIVLTADAAGPGRRPLLHPLRRRRDQAQHRVHPRR